MKANKSSHEFSVLCGAICAVMVMAGFVYDYVNSPLNSSRKPAMVRMKKKNLKAFYENKKCSEMPVITGFVDKAEVVQTADKKSCETKLTGWAWNDFNLSSTRYGIKVNGKHVLRNQFVSLERSELKKDYPCLTTPGFEYTHKPVGGFYDSEQVEIELLTESQSHGEFLSVAHKKVDVPKACIFQSDINKFRLHNVKAVPAAGKLHDTRLVAIGFAPGYPANSIARLVWKNKETGERLETKAKLGASRSRIFSSAIRAPASSHAWTVAAYLETMKDECIAPPDDSSATVCH